MTDVGDVLLDARNYLATGKWCKGKMADGDDNRCILGALVDAMRPSRSPTVSRNAESALEQHIGPEYAEYAGSEMALVAAFNDHPDTTLADVLSLFDKTLADLGRLGDVQ